VPKSGGPDDVANVVVVVDVDVVGGVKPVKAGGGVVGVVGSAWAADGANAISAKIPTLANRPTSTA